MPFVQIVTRFQTKKRLTLWPQQTGALLRLISVIQNQGVIYEAVFKVLFECECGIFLARCYFNICFYWFFFFFTICLCWDKKIRIYFKFYIINGELLKLEMMVIQIMLLPILNASDLGIILPSIWSSFFFFSE